MKENEKHFVIGYIKPLNCEEHTLSYAIKKTQDFKIDDVVEIGNDLDNILFYEGDASMVKGLKNYVGSSILGYRLVLPRLECSANAKDIKNIGRLRKGNNNNIKCLKKVKRTFNK